MGEVSAALLGPPDPWILTGNARDLHVSLQADLSVGYGDGSSDTLPALTVANTAFSGGYLFADAITSVLLYRIGDFALTTTLPISGYSPRLGINHTTNTLYAMSGDGTSSGTSFIDIFDLSSFSRTTITLHLRTDDGIEAFGLDETTNRAYILVENNGLLAAQITVVDLATKTVIATIPLTGTTGIGDGSVDVYPATGTVYVAAYSELFVIAESSNTVTTTISLGTDARSCAVNRTTHTIYIASNASGCVVVNGATNTITTTISTGAVSPQAIAVNSTANKVYIGGFSSLIAVIDGATNTVSSYINAPLYTWAFAIDQTNNIVYAGGDLAAQILVIDGATAGVTKTASTQGGQLFLVYNPATSVAYTIDRTAFTWALYTIKGSGVLSAIQESYLPFIGDDYALLGRITATDILAA